MCLTLFSYNIASAVSIYSLGSVDVSKLWEDTGSSCWWLSFIQCSNVLQTVTFQNVYATRAVGVQLVFVRLDWIVSHPILISYQLRNDFCCFSDSVGSIFCSCCRWTIESYFCCPNGLRVWGFWHFSGVGYHFLLYVLGLSWINWPTKTVASSQCGFF